MKRRFSLLLLSAVILLSGCSAAKYAALSSYPAPTNPYRPQGSLKTVFYDSSEPGLDARHAYVYLPSGYDDTDRRYPVMYLLHGARGNETVWMDKGNLLHNIDSLTSCGAMLPTIVVLPNVNQYDDAADYGNARLKSALESFYEVDGTVESRFVNDVVNATDSLFRTIPDKDHRAVAGLSIGAMQSLHLSANFPDCFGYIGMFSPMVNSFLKPGPDNGFYGKLAQKQKIQFENPPRLFVFMIGKTDFFYPSIKSYCSNLQSKGIPAEIVIAEGGHEWYNWEEFCNQFLKRLWK